MIIACTERRSRNRTIFGMHSLLDMLKKTPSYSRIRTAIVVGIVRVKRAVSCEAVADVALRLKKRWWCPQV
jgi:hypothetical protein